MAVSVAWLFALFFCSALGFQVPKLPATEEFYGPFSTWANVQKNFNATGNGVTDDTAAIQNALNATGVSSYPVLYFPAGVYLITSSLYLIGREFVTFFGEHPSNTTIRWGGPKNESMLIISGLQHEAWSRFTFDGAGTASNCIWINDFTFPALFPSTVHQFSDMIIQDCHVGMKGGGPSGQLDSEVTILRATFLRHSFAGVSLNRFSKLHINSSCSYNALDWWISDSIFISNYYGATNEEKAGFNVAGWSHSKQELATFTTAFSTTRLLQIMPFITMV